jgi:hypothetical protein
MLPNSLFLGGLFFGLVFGLGLRLRLLGFGGLRFVFFGCLYWCWRRCGAAGATAGVTCLTGATGADGAAGAAAWANAATETKPANSAVSSFFIFNEFLK